MLQVLPYLLELKLALNRCWSRLEAGCMPGSQVNKCWVPAVGMAVQCIQRGVASRPRGRSECSRIVAICKPAFSMFLSCGMAETSKKTASCEVCTVIF